MILHPTTVELKKIHYYNGKSIPTISREIWDKQPNVIIKKNIFGDRWVLKINETNQENPQQQQQKSKYVIVVYILMFCCIIIALFFGLFFTIEKKIHFHDNKPSVQNNSIKIFKILPINTKNSTIIPLRKPRRYCNDCINGKICLKQNEIDYPKCLDPIDKKDPTGCGGYCLINTQFCQLLDMEHQIYQCSNIKNVLKCPKNSFNCGNMCIGLDKKCDGIIHCSNHSDELDCDCDLDKNFRCGNRTSCLNKSKICNGIVDCYDKSDEINCSTIQTNCNNNSSILCRNGQCIPKEYFCDGYPQCSDKSDEPLGCQL